MIKGDYRIEFIKVQSMEEYQGLLKEYDNQSDYYSIHNKCIEEKSYINGYCLACHSRSEFLMDYKYSDYPRVNFRERLVCLNCNLNNRQRLMMTLTRNIVDIQENLQKIYTYEKVTPFYTLLENNFKEIEIIGSEYLGENLRPGRTLFNIRHEDALNLSFNDNSIDLIISNDVFEHVPHITQVLKEAYRVLKNNSKLIFTVPFNCYSKTIQRCTKVKDSIIHYLPEAYHENPLSDEGSLVYYDFGLDLLDYCGNAGFREVYMVIFSNHYYGNIGLSPIIVTQK